MQTLNIGICGYGTVGSGVYHLLQQNALDIERRLQKKIEVVHIGVRKPRPNLPDIKCRQSADIFAVANDPEVNILVEVIGGTTVAYELAMQAIHHGKHIVTANKALIAQHGVELFKAAKNRGVAIAFEAAVAGGIPIIKVLREGLAANQIRSIAGIINGTSNFILTEMAQKSRDFHDVLREAQALGYAEVDPTFDIEGIDAAHKLTILASIAFGVPLQFSAIYTEGITKLSPKDMQFADELGYRIKHLGIAKYRNETLELRVHPTLIPKEQLLANVDGVMNAVYVQSDAAGPSLYCGPGAGAGPTASAVVADLIDIARHFENNGAGLPDALGFETLITPKNLSIEEICTSYYLHLNVNDRVGVMAKITKLFSEHEISIEALIQKDSHSKENIIPIIILTNDVEEREINVLLHELSSMSDVVGEIVKIRVEQLAS